MVVTEALARGLPVIATQVGGVPEALGRAPGGGRPGLLVPPATRVRWRGALGGGSPTPACAAHLRAAALAGGPLLPTWAGTSAVAWPACSPAWPA